ncbi:MAG: hypothetical protein RLY21_2806 [Planctomycetota bacterium]|jgi:hypothetical protein
MASEEHTSASGVSSSPASDELHPEDAAWIARRSPVAPIVLGVLSILLSPVLLGLFFGPLALRAGIELRRQGVRGAGTIVAIATSLVGIIVSVTTALLWGAVLSGVLLGRDAMRTAESWRGEVIRSSTVDARVAGVETQIDLARPVAGAPRHAILFIGVGWDPCAQAVRTLSEAAANHPDVPVIVIDREAPAQQVEAFTRLHAAASAERFAYVGPIAELPAPLEQAAALPTLVIVGSDGVIEYAIVGAHPTTDIEKLLRGDAARAPRGPSLDGGR